MRLVSMLIGATLLLALTGPVSGQTVDKSPDLNAGGKTVGGPGTFKGTSPNDLNLVTFASGSLNVCATLANVGGAVVNLFLSIGANSVAAQVLAGTTRTLCAANVTEVHAECTGNPGTSCKYLWRVDAF